MLFLSITKPELLQALPNQIDGIEIRLDLFPSWDLDLIKTILVQSTHPVMITLRSPSHGGSFSGSEEEREAKLLALLELNPPFIDLEYDMRKDFLEKVLKSYPQTAFILSYHNFENTPEDLEKLLKTMASYPAYQYKIAAQALSTNDALRMLLFGRKHTQVSVICMGEKGEFARVLGSAAGNTINYASLEKKEETAPGQLSVADLVNIYHFPSLNKETTLYGLIGDPILNSQGHLYHNAVFIKNHLNAVYVKMSVKTEELSTFFPLAKKIGFRGLSVTMPLKEAILPFLDNRDEKVQGIGAANTLLFEKEKLLGTNTDGIGALDAIEKREFVRNKIVILIGAGGAAKAIAFEALARGATVWILNRTVSKAKELATILHCHGGSLTDFPSYYDILINCSPDPMPIILSKIRSNALVMDIVYIPRETLFLQEAARLGCRVVYGEEMFLNQAAAQTTFWFGNKTEN